MDRDVSVIGLGRVGLPLALSLADRGLSVVGVDRDADRLQAVRDGRMPFEETGGEEVMRRVHDSGRLEVSDRVADAARARHIILTHRDAVVLAHRDRHARHPHRRSTTCSPCSSPATRVVLRSTIAPGTTEFVAGYLESKRGFAVGEDLFVSHAPERIAAGKFFEEIDSLPQIVGGVGERSTEVCRELFDVYDSEVVETTPIQAELAKIWTNILRYATFALPNLLMMDCEQYGANVFDVIELINRDYPRGGIKMPGFTAGTCLRKDFTFSEERSHAPGMLLAVSRVNESVPLFLVEGMKRRLGRAARAQGRRPRPRVQGRHRRRARLAGPQARPPARARARRGRGPRPARPDAHADRSRRRSAAPTPSSSRRTTASSAAPSALREIARLAAPEALVVDPWNCFGAAQVFGYAAEIAAMAPASEAQG